MFEDFARVWTPVLPSPDLPADRPVGFKVAGTPVVLFRDREGRPVALVDRCPHRGVALSLGTVRDGCLVCPFHGWELRGDGSVAHVPWVPDAKREKLGGIALPTAELAGLVWIHTAVEPPAEGPQVHPAFLRDDVRVSSFVVTWKTHWTRAMENMLDWPHLPFVHARTIGKELTEAVRRGRMDVVIERQPWGAHTHVVVDGVRKPGELDYRFPNVMNLFIPIPDKTLMMGIACVPEGPETTRMILTTVRSFLRSRLLDGFFHRENMKIATEDKAIVESSWPAEIPEASAERSTRIDELTLLFRKRYLADLKGSTAAPSGALILPRARPAA